MGDIIIGNEVLKYKDEIIQHLSELVKIKSVRGASEEGKPYGIGCYNVLKYVLDLGQSMGFKAVNVDGYMGYIEYGNGDEYMAVISHLDVVPEGDGWNFEPYGGTIHEGKIYGRGVSDNKASAIASIYALKAIRDTNTKLNYKIRILFGCAEETDMTDIDYYFSKYTLPVFGFVPDVGYDIVNREKGIIDIVISEDINDYNYKKITKLQGGNAANIVPAKCSVKIDKKSISISEQKDIKNFVSENEGYSLVEGSHHICITSIGKPAHGAAPQYGVNAIGKMLQLLSVMKSKYSILDFIHNYLGMEYTGEKLGINCTDVESGALTLNVGIIEMNNEKIDVTLNIRYPVTCNGQSIVNSMKNKLNEFGLYIDECSISEPLNMPSDNPWIDCLKDAYKIQTGDDIEVISISGGTYSRKTSNTCVGFGGVGHNGHKADEYVDIERLMEHGKIMTQGMYEMATSNVLVGNVE